MRISSEGDGDSTGEGRDNRSTAKQPGPVKNQFQVILQLQSKALPMKLQEMTSGIQGIEGTI